MERKKNKYINAFFYCIFSYPVGRPDIINIIVLPARIGGKLLFPLCQLCAQNLAENSCEHNESERALVGTWVTEEVPWREAIR